MALLPAVLNVIGILVLTHAVYSANEHSTLLALTTAPHASLLPSSSSTTSAILRSLIPHITLPLDITLETLIAVGLICVGLVLGSPALRPIEWARWAGQLEAESAEELAKGREEGEVLGNSFAALEHRNGFLDIRRKRKEFAEWVREGRDGVVGTVN
ncbi:hypothetical protein B0A49_08262 [Cryomyces minteri]|uniref:Uncharacterized protein n=1 Tax=Cryomyces minteri TaxID=331657 RepID=A0A4U0WNI0_9PEZI|nr:hypothetical protein B0A49_08262 [Cryomyces minteri]